MFSRDALRNWDSLMLASPTSAKQIRYACLFTLLFQQMSHQVFRFREPQQRAAFRFERPIEPDIRRSANLLRSHRPFARNGWKSGRILTSYTRSLMRNMPSDLLMLVTMGSTMIAS